MSKGRPIDGQGQHHPLSSGSKSELKAESGSSIDIHSLCFLIQEQCAQLSHIRVTTVEAILEARSSRLHDGPDSQTVSRNTAFYP